MPRTKSLSAAAKSARLQQRKSVRQRQEQASSTTQLPTTSTSPVESRTSSLTATKRRSSASPAVTQPTRTVKPTTTGKRLPSSPPGKRRRRSSDFRSARWRCSYERHIVSARAGSAAAIKHKYRTDRLYSIRFQTGMRLKYTSAVSYHRYWKQKMRHKMRTRYASDVEHATEKRQKMRQHMDKMRTVQQAKRSTDTIETFTAHIQEGPIYSVYMYVVS